MSAVDTGVNDSDGDPVAIRIHVIINANEGPNAFHGRARSAND